MSEVRAAAHDPHPQRRERSRTWLWILSGVCVLALAILLLLFVFRATSVTIVPQSQPVTFDSSAQFTAYPAPTAARGTISYTIQSTDIEDSEVVQSNGVQHVETKASGTITVVNNYSTAAVKLVKNTRFQSQGGLIFRVPADVSVPGKKGSTPGKVNVTVVADQVGQQYNIGAQSRFTLPGLKSSGSEYTNVYGYSIASTTGGFSGDQPGVAQSDMDTAVAKVRARLQEKAAAFESSQNTDSATVLGIMTTYADLPNTAEAGNTVRIHETAHVAVAVAPSDVFASAVAQTVAANAAAGTVKIVPGEDFAMSIKEGASWGTDPLIFAIAGRAQVVWIVDTEALANALAGRDQGAFQTIVSNFPGVESARARIEPFWENTFPTKAGDIRIAIEEVKTLK